MTAEHIFAKLQHSYPQVALATSYNNLNKLCEDGATRKISVEGMCDRYDHIQRHDHLVCHQCGQLLDVDLGDLTQQLEAKAGISILSYDLKLIYVCENCKKTINGKECE